MVSDTGGPDFLVEYDFSRWFESIDKSTLFLGIIIGIFLGIIIHIFYLWFKRIYNKTIQDFPGENNDENNKE